MRLMRGERWRDKGRGQTGCGSGRHESDGLERIEVSGGYEGNTAAQRQSRKKKEGRGKEKWGRREETKKQEMKKMIKLIERTEKKKMEVGRGRRE